MVTHLRSALGYCSAATGDVQAARRYLQQGLSLAAEIGSLTATLYALVGFATLKAQAGALVGAAEWLGLVLSDPAATAETNVQQRAESLLADLRAALPAEQLDAALARGAKLELDEVVREILRDAQDRPTPPLR